MLGSHALLCVRLLGIPLFLDDSTDAYTTRLGNVHYVYHNVAVMVAIPNRCSASTTPGECLPD